MLIILLNFVVAKASDSYTVVTEKEDYYFYLMKAQFNAEAMALIDFLGIRVDTEVAQVLYLRIPYEEAGENELNLGNVIKHQKSLEQKIDVISQEI
jgi:hypothetical protein